MLLIEDKSKEDDLLSSDRACFNHFDEIAPDLNASSKEPYLSINLSTSRPSASISFRSLSSKVDVSIPASLIFFISLSQLEENAPSKILLRLSEEPLMMLLR